MNAETNKEMEYTGASRQPAIITVCRYQTLMASYKTQAPGYNALLAFVAVLFWLLIPNLAQAQSNFQPILETLDYRQLQQQMKAAPSGSDKPLAEPDMALQVSQHPNTLYQQAEPSILEESAKDIQEPVSLEERIETQIVRTELQQYGYDLFQSAPTTFAQVDDLPVPPGYLVGPGDSLVVQLYGGRNVEYNLVITRNGKLLLPELGPIDVSGLTIEELKTTISKRYEQQVIGAKTVVSMNQLRTIQIRLTGEVEKPGAYTVSGLSTMVDALLSTGGIRYSGSLRRIELKRRGKVLSTLDLYDLLMKGDTSADINLSHNDVIHVPAIGDVVYVGGEVQRPAIYELRTEQTLHEVIQLAGGLLPTASIDASHIERIVGRRYKTLIDLSALNQPTSQFSQSSKQLPNLRIEAGDLVRLLPVADTMDEVVLLSGHIKRPGGYQLRKGMRVSDLLLNRDQVMPNTDLDFALLVREQPGTRRTEIAFIKLAEALMNPGSTWDTKLHPRDELRLFNLKPERAEGLSSLVAELDLQATDYRPSQTASVQGNARYTGRFPLQAGMRMLDFLRISGGIQQGTDMDYLVISRTRFPDDHISMRSYSLHSAIRSPETDSNPEIFPGDRIYLFDDTLDRSALMKQDLQRLRQQSNYTDNELLVRANGLFAHPGLYPLEEGMRASDLVCAAGGLAVTAYGLEAELSRYQIVGGDKRRLDHLLLASEDLVGLCREQEKISSRTRANQQQQRLAEYGNLRLKDGRHWVTDIIDPVYFDSGKSSLVSGDIERLRKVMSHYKEKADDVKVLVVGHTDSMALSNASKAKYGTNQGLSVARAKEVAEQLSIALRLNSYEIEVQGRGDTQPVASNDNVEGRKSNRRTEVQLLLINYPDQKMDSAVIGSNLFPSQDEQNLVHFVDSETNPLLRPHDQLTFVQKPNWIPKAKVELTGEVFRPGLYVIDRGETLCEVMQRAGGITSDAYVFGSELTRKSVRDMQQKTLDGIQDQLDDILVELSMSHSARNNEKTPAGDSKDEYLRIINQLDRARPNGRLVIDFSSVLDCKKKARVVLEDGDKLHVPRIPTYVNVAGQVYVPTSHMYREERNAEDYIELSGGSTVIGRVKHAYIIQANGEVMSYTGRRSSKRITKARIQPGAEIVVPLNLDRMNGTERLQSWTRSLMETALFAGILL